ncbi:MAG: Gfo/Idh/MocA family protein, partial [Chitinophagales bacterium]
MSRIKIGVLGAGHLGKIHIRLLKEIEAFDLVGFYDPNEVVAEKISAAFGIPCFASIADLIEAVDAVDIVSPTVTHYENALEAVQAGKHIFVE